MKITSLRISKETTTYIKIEAIENTTKAPAQGNPVAITQAPETAISPPANQVKSNGEKNLSSGGNNIVNKPKNAKNNIKNKMNLTSVKSSIKSTPTQI